MGSAEIVPQFLFNNLPSLLRMPDLFYSSGLQINRYYAECLCRHIINIIQCESKAGLFPIACLVATKKNHICRLASIFLKKIAEIRKLTC